MYRSILVPLDGSPSAEFAVPVAQGIARRCAGAVHLLHVHMPLAVASGVRLAGGAVYRDWESEAKGQEEDYLTGLQRRLPDSADVTMDHRIEDGSVVDTVLRCAGEVGTDLIVMTTHGRGPLARAWLGSVADGVARRSGVPVLLLRPTADPEPMGEHLFHNILIALDGSELAEQILEHAIAIGSLAGAHYMLARVVTPPLFTGYTPSAEGVLADAAAAPGLAVLIEEAERYLEKTAEGLRARNLSVETQVIVEAQAAPGLLEYARERSADMVAMATHGRTGLSRLVLGSVADKVLRGTTAPILLIRPAS